MKKMHFKVAVKASRETVWKILWEDGTLRQWAGIVDPGTYMLGKLEEGKTIQFNSEEGYGVTSFVDKLIPNEYVLLKHKADTKDYGNNDREDQWTGGNESYTLNETDGITTLVLEFDVPEELEEIMNTSYPKALNKIKELCEST